MRRPVLDVSALPPIAYGSRTTIWWGVLGLIAIEGAALALTAVAALYLRQNFMTWPPYGTPPPGLAAATANVVLLALSVWPMYVAASNQNRRLKESRNRSACSANGRAALSPSSVRSQCSSSRSAL